MKRVVRHGLSYHPLYRVWADIKTRCLNKHSKSYSYYGEKGIKVCDEWKDDFYNFYLWSINNGYRKGLTIDRIDNKGNYEPQNCRWVTMKEQNNNKNNTTMVTFNGKNQSLSVWCEELNIDYERTKCRLTRTKTKYTIDEAFVLPKRSKEKNIIYTCQKVLLIDKDDIFNSASEAERKTGIDHRRIIECCIGKREQAGNFHWRYINE